MKLTKQQQQEIKDLQSQENKTKRVIAPELEKILFEAIPILDHGFIRVIDYMGDDTSIVQAARVSYGKGTKKVSTDSGLIKYLMRHWHSTPFEMCEIKYHIKLPIFIARQWIRHRTANVNEYSARYSILDKEFYLPSQENLAAQSKNNRQGRGEVLTGDQAKEVLNLLKNDAERTYDNYQTMLNEKYDGSVIEEKDIVLSKNRKTKETTKEKFVSFIKKNFVGSYIILNFIHDFTNLVFSLSKKNEFISEKDKFKTNDEYIRHQASDKYKRDQWTVNQDIYFEYEDGVKKSIHFMSKLNEICNKHNINLTIAVYPMFTQVYHNDTVSIQEKIWKDFSKKKNINFINYFPVFIKKDRNLNERINVIKKFYIPFDLHWNKLGNKVAADYFIKNYKLD